MFLVLQFFDVEPAEITAYDTRGQKLSPIGSYIRASAAELTAGSIEDAIADYLRPLFAVLHDKLRSERGGASNVSASGPR